jgi:hypothetical protein
VAVVGHDDESVNAPRAADRGSTKVFLEPVAVGVVAYDVLTTVAACHEVVDSVGILNAQSSCHASITTNLKIGPTPWMDNKLENRSDPMDENRSDPMDDRDNLNLGPRSGHPAPT